MEEFAQKWGNTQILNLYYPEWGVNISTLIEHTRFAD